MGYVNIKWLFYPAFCILLHFVEIGSSYILSKIDVCRRSSTRSQSFNCDVSMTSSLARLSSDNVMKIANYQQTTNHIYIYIFSPKSLFTIEACYMSQKLDANNNITLVRSSQECNNASTCHITVWVVTRDTRCLHRDPRLHTLVLESCSQHL